MSDTLTLPISGQPVTLGLDVVDSATPPNPVTTATGGWSATPDGVVALVPVADTNDNQVTIAPAEGVEVGATCTIVAQATLDGDSVAASNPLTVTIGAPPIGGVTIVVVNDPNQ